MLFVLFLDLDEVQLIHRVALVHFSFYVCGGCVYYVGGVVCIVTSGECLQLSRMALPLALLAGESFLLGSAAHQARLVLL